MLPRSRVWVADDEAGLPAGFAALTPGRLDHLYVAPGSQGRGLGDALLREVKLASPDGLTLHVFQRNAPARRFYERRGFRLIALRDGQENEEREPDAIYT
nr:GNAT family N-acetyltransferase [Roseococcus suduntuyensis]